MHTIEVETRYPLNMLLAKDFHTNYPMVFKKTMAGLIDQLLSKEQDSWTYTTALKDLLSLGSPSEYSQEVLEILGAGFNSSDYRRFDRSLNDIIRDLNLSEEMTAELHRLRQSAETNYSKRLFNELDGKFPSWRTEDMSPFVLDEADAAVRGLSTAGANKAFFKGLHDKVLEAVRSAQSTARIENNSNLKTKPELGGDVLLYLATFEPRTWDNLNLDYRSAGVTDYMRSKAKRGLAALSFVPAEQEYKEDEDEE